MSMPKEYQLACLRECPVPESLQMCDTPEKAVEYWRLHVATDPKLNLGCECFVVLLLNVRKRVLGHHVVSIGLLHTILVHPREVLRAAITANASAVVCVHNHPSGVMPNAV
jgi:DNA repair protein RadC